MPKDEIIYVTDANILDNPRKRLYAIVFAGVELALYRSEADASMGLVVYGKSYSSFLLSVKPVDL